MSKTIHETKITRIGASAADFLEENMVVFFHEDVPAYLADFCFLIETGKGDYEIQAGDLLVLDSTRCPITAIGEVALENFRKLGHLTIRFDGAAQAENPGTMHVQPCAIPPLTIGTAVRFVREL